MAVERTGNMISPRCAFVGFGNALILLFPEERRASHWHRFKKTGNTIRDISYRQAAATLKK